MRQNLGSSECRPAAIVFRVQGLGCRVRGFDLGFHWLDFGAQALDFRV